ncbi:MAG: hypothetical protein HW421_1382 [Ignavibacteria bacterium]|nr:hypothetical protein [Ignavibacteria bacterium]
MSEICQGEKMKKFTFYFSVLLLTSFYIAIAQTQTIRILHFGDTHSNLLPGGEKAGANGSIGGISKAATVIKNARAVDPNTIVVNVGDFFLGDLMFNLTMGKVELSWMLDMKLTAMTLGNHDFDLTPAMLANSMSNAFPDKSFPVLGTNMFINDSNDAAVKILKNIVTPYLIKDYNGVKIGLFGFIHPDANQMSLPSIYIDTSLVAIATAAVTELKSKNCDLIILLSHAGEFADTTLAASVPGIDLIIGGHEHKFLNPFKKIKNSNGETAVFQSGAFYRELGDIKLTLDVSKKISNIDYSIITLNNSIADEANTKTIMDELVFGIEQSFGTVFSKGIAVAESTFEEEAKDLLKSGSHDTPVGNLITDALLAYGGTDIAITVCGLTAQPLYKGDILPNDIFRMIGYGFNEVNGLDDHPATFKITGQDLKLSLEFSLMNIENNDEFFVQCAGMEYYYYTDTKPRLYNAYTSAPHDIIKPSETYSITTNNYIAQLLKLNGVNIIDENVSQDTTIYQIVQAYIRGKTIKPKVEGRVYSDVKEKLSVGDISFEQPEIDIYPNPARENVTIGFSRLEESYCRFKIFDILGNEVLSSEEKFYSMGFHTVSFDIRNFPDGVYYFRIIGGANSAGKKLIVSRH